MEDLEDSKDNIDKKPLEYNFSGLNSASGKAFESEGANGIRVLKSELKNDVNIKCEPLDYAYDEPDSVSVIGFHSILSSEKLIKREVEDEGEQKKIDIKYESLEYELKRPAVKNANEHAEKQFECQKCSYKSKYKYALNRHFKYKHAENRNQKMPRYACKLCSFKTFHSGNLSRHNMSKHAENRRHFECPKCSYKSRDNYNLRKHIFSIHEKEKAPQHACQICSFRSIHKSSLNMHMRIHTEFSLACTLCQKSFKQKKSLDSHYVSTHRDQSDSFKHLLTYKVKQCSKCSYITVGVTSFKRHLLTHEEDQSKFKFECYTCGYKCVEKSHLKIHVRIHTDQLPFGCSECNQRFNQKHQLDGHIVSRHKEDEELMKTVTNKIHQCIKCNFKAIKSFEFKKHINWCNNK